jgi:uncharacterized membrane protein YgdD (TMEM256/DUF423 family)
MKKKNEKRQIFTKILYFLIASFIFGCIALGYHAVGVELMAIKRGVLGMIIFNLSFLAAHACGLITIILLIQSRKILQLSGIVQLIILIGFILFFYSSLSTRIRDRRFYIGGEKTRLADLKLIRREIMEYVEINGRLPDANSWCDPLCSHEKNAPEANARMFHKFFSRFAFNENLSEKSVDQLNDNILLIIEAEGSLNNFGGAELLTQPLPRYEYYLFPQQKFKYFMFVDGTIAKYRQRDGAISKFEGNPDNFDLSSISKDVDSFGPFTKKGSNPYSTLRWK